MIGTAAALCERHFNHFTNVCLVYRVLFERDSVEKRKRERERQAYSSWFESIDQPWFDVFRMGTLHRFLACGRPAYASVVGGEEVLRETPLIITTNTTTITTNTTTITTTTIIIIILRLCCFLILSVSVSNVKSQHYYSSLLDPRPFPAPPPPLTRTLRTTLDVS
ncbi:hypothetical protein E2C01_025610 [Portunus trituberculatus]|uniref:Uncharacterized protein n=1 Tax=Portunus trituberculatus TaxID=210409 RepID=A0A5B7EDD2_PORTR|nr:hypothetical protein [Portunus trituberculatus]